MKNLILLFFTCSLILSCNNAQKNQSSSNDTNTASSDEATKTSTISKDLSSSQDNERLQGIDISSYQTNIDWDKVKEDQIAFVFIKSTGGETYVDPAFTQHWNDVKSANLMRGAYHFYYTKDDPTTQAKFFISKVLPLSEKSDLPPVIDIETDGVNTKISVDQLQEDIKTFLGIVEKEFGRKPILYTSHAFAQEYFDNTDFDQYYLWLAEYQSASPPIPNGWASMGWTFWQNSQSATVSGINGNVDHDYFKGSLEDLKNL